METDQKAAIVSELKQVLRSAQSILFEGNNYSEEWASEAAKRGLSNIKKHCRSVKRPMSVSKQKQLS